MKLTEITLFNFRGYKKSTKLKIDSFTALVGRNDIGKSTILDALDLFFNDGKGTIKYDPFDICINGEEQKYEISAVFSDVPDKVIVDSAYHTSLKEEFLLNKKGNLEVKKTFNGKKCTAVSLKAFHPTNPNCSDLHQKKKNELKAYIQENGIECDNLNVNAVMRKSIWDKYADDLRLNEVLLDVNSGDDTKKIWEKLSSLLPVYSLFQSDRNNSDNDKEVQDPLKLAVAQFIKEEEIQNALNTIAVKVEGKLQEVSDRTLIKLREMDEKVADSLTPVLPSADNLKWAEVFTKSVSITSDEEIPINKRGSGIKRLILLNFFRAEAERRQEISDGTGIIYAIEEPETSQHFNNQQILAEALKRLSKAPNTQVIITTHSGVVVKKLDYDNLRLVSVDKSGEKCIKCIEEGMLIYPSLNEVNYTAFDEITEEYHNELYGYIFEQKWLKEFENGKSRREYIRQNNDGSLKKEKKTLSHYIRDVYHHPENTNNAKYTAEELSNSINEMRDFIKNKKASNC